jgi:type II secretory pathway component PulC
MNLKLLKFQALLCALLCLILAAEWGYAEFSNGELQQQLKEDIADKPSVAELPSIANLKTAATEFNEVVERPLFIEGRKPIIEAPVENAQQAEISQIDDWSLIGIYYKDNQPVALFSKKTEAKKYLKIKVGQLISGCVLTEIQSDRVILQQAGQQKTVLLRKPRAEPTAVPGGKPAARPPPKPPKNLVPPPNINPENANDEKN